MEWRQGFTAVCFCSSTLSCSVSLCKDNTDATSTVRIYYYDSITTATSNTFTGDTLQVICLSNVLVMQGAWCFNAWINAEWIPDAHQQIKTLWLEYRNIGWMFLVFDLKWSPWAHAGVFQIAKLDMVSGDDYQISWTLLLENTHKCSRSRTQLQPGNTGISLLYISYIYITFKIGLLWGFPTRSGTQLLIMLNLLIMGWYFSKVCFFFDYLI